METPFLKKMKIILDDPKNCEVICWTHDKTRIQIRNQKAFQEKILTKYFRHNKLSSFIRQLNFYGFKKLRKYSNHVFTHLFLQNGKGLQEIFIKRKKSVKRKVVSTNSLSIFASRFKFNQETHEQRRVFSNLTSKHQNERGNQNGTPIQNITLQPLNLMWVMPVQQVAHQILSPLENYSMCGNFTYNYYQN